MVYNKVSHYHFVLHSNTLLRRLKTDVYSYDQIIYFNPLNIHISTSKFFVVLKSNTYKHCTITFSMRERERGRERGSCLKQRKNKNEVRKMMRKGGERECLIQRAKIIEK